MEQFITVIVKPTLDCNIKCRHCYHSTGCDSTLMDISTFERTVKLVKDSYRFTRFIWHGGEPILAPQSFYKEAFSIEKKYFGKNACENTIQTNGSLLNQRFIEFCKSNRVNLGISYEGGFGNGLRPGLDEKYIDSMVEYMVKKQHMFLISATIHGGNIDKIDNIYEKFTGMGASLSLNPVIDLGRAKDNPDLHLDPDMFAERMISLFERWAKDPNVKVPVLPFFPYVITAMDGYANISDCPHASCLTKWICVYPNGDVYPCGKACPPEYRLGNINEVSSIEELFDSDGIRNILIPSIKRRDACKDCSIYQYCNGGCTIDALTDGDATAPGGASCRIYKALFSHIKDFVDDIMATKPDMSGYNGFIKDVVLGKLINPQIIDGQSIQ